MHPIFTKEFCWQYISCNWHWKPGVKKKKKMRGRNKQETDSTIGYRNNKPRGILGEHEEVIEIGFRPTWRSAVSQFNIQLLQINTKSLPFCVIWICCLYICSSYFVTGDRVKTIKFQCQRCKQISLYPDPFTEFESLKVKSSKLEAMN